MKKKVVIIGAGKVGTALGHLLFKQGFPVVAMASRTAKSLKRAKRYLPQAYLTRNLAEAAQKGEVVFLAVKDEAIRSVTEEIAAAEGFKKGQTVFHLSGALTTGVLKKAKEKGAVVATLHPIQTLANVELAVSNLPGSIFGFSGEKKAKPVAQEIVKSLKGTLVEVKEDLKPAYHAAACLASNYLVTLAYLSLNLYQLSGLSPEKAKKALIPLLKGTIKNLEKTGPVEALTGPIARGDLEIIRQHLNILKEVCPEIIPFYCEGGKMTAQVALEKGLTKKTYQELINLLKSFS